MIDADQKDIDTLRSEFNKGEKDIGMVKDAYLGLKTKLEGDISSLTQH